MLWWLHLFGVISSCLLTTINSLHLSGEWFLETEPFLLVAKFGVQQMDHLDKENTIGFIYGNITGEDGSASKLDERVALFIVPETEIQYLYDHSPFDGRRSDMCSVMLHNVSQIAFEPKCLVDGKRNDILRWIPCEKNKLCSDEEDPKKVVGGYQFTFRVQEPVMPQYWYVVFVACNLNVNCTWVRSQRVTSVSYDLWLLNGNPLTTSGNLFAKQFSFDEQNLPEIYFLAFAAYVILGSIQTRAASVSRHRRLPPRQRLLSWCIALETVGLFFQSVNAVIFSVMGQAVGLFVFVGEVLSVVGICVFCLLLILLSRGWSLNNSASSAFNRLTYYAWIIISAVHITFYLHNYFYTERVADRIDIYKSEAGYSIVAIRLLQALWFLIEVKRTLRRELNDGRAVFLAHLGAAYMVWFVYLVLALYRNCGD